MLNRIFAVVQHIRQGLRALRAGVRAAVKRSAPTSVSAREVVQRLLRGVRADLAGHGAGRLRVGGVEVVDVLLPVLLLLDDDSRGVAWNGGKY